MSENKKGNYLTQAWLVLLLAIMFGGALAGMEIALKDRIAENKLRETLSQVPMLVPGATTGEEQILSGKRVFFAKDDADKIIGYIIPGRGQGFADKIEILLGLDAQLEKVTGVYVLEQKETPGLGNFITGEDWRSQFKGKSTDSKLSVVKDGSAGRDNQKIDALSGATISSDAVTNIVNQTIETAKTLLSGKGE